MGQMSKHYPARAEFVGSARSAVSEFAVAMGADPAKVHSIELAVGEACSNVVVHAYRDSASPGEMMVSASMVDGDLRVEVVDDGAGMIPRLDSPGIGMGVPLMLRLSDSLETRTSARGGTEICLRFSLPHGEGAPRREPQPAFEAAPSL